MSVFEFLYNELKNGRSVVFVVVLNHEGSVPGKRGFKMAVSSGGKICGSIGGGAIENNMIGLAKKVLIKKKIKPILIYRVHNLKDLENSSGMICGGSQTVGVALLGRKDLPVLKKILKSEKTQAKSLLVFTEKGIDFKIAGESDPAYFFEKESDNKWIYQELIGKKDLFYIFGGGHVALALSPLLFNLGFKVIVFDNRKNIATMEDNGWTDKKIITSFVKAGKFIKEGKNVWAAIMTPSHLYDEVVLRQLLNKKLRYLGMMASEKKKQEVFKNLKKEGISAARLKFVHCPIGISVSSHTPFEIAISIASEVIKIKNN